MPLRLSLTDALRGCFDGNAVTLELNPDLPYSTFLCGKGNGGLRGHKRCTALFPLCPEGRGTRSRFMGRGTDLWAGKIREAVDRCGPLSVMYLPSAGSMYFSKKLLPHVFASLGGYTTKKRKPSAGSFGLKQTFGEVPVTLPRLLKPILSACSSGAGTPRDPFPRGPAC